MRIKQILWLGIITLASLLLSSGYASNQAPDKKQPGSDPPPDPKVATMKGHTSFVRSVAFSPDGKLLASGSIDGTIKIWRVGIWKELATLSGHNGNVFSVSFSPDGKFLASGSNDSNIKIWETEDWQEVKTIVGNSGPIYSVAFSPDGQYLASGSFKVIKLWDVKDWLELKMLEGHSNWVTSVAFSSDMKYLASASADTTVKIWDASTWLEVAKLEGHRSWVNSVSFSPDGKFLASGSGDNTTKIWQSEDWKELTTLKGHHNVIFSTAFSPDGEYLATGSWDHTIRLWRVKDWYNLTTTMTHSKEILSVAFHPDGKYLASGSHDATINLWDMETASIDWVTGQPALPPYIIAELELIGESNNVLAGSTVKLRMTIENRGRGDGYRLSGRIDSRLKFFGDRRFLFGKVEVGKILVREITVDIPKAHFTMDTALKMKWKEANDYIPNPINLKLHIEALPRPKFSYNYIIVDDFSGNSVGNGDGRIHQGETIDFLVGVLNFGLGEAEKINVEITTPAKEGVRLHIPRNVISNLGPGEYKRVRLAVTVLRTSPLLRLPLVLTINDPVFGIKLIDKLNLPIDSNIAPRITEVKQIASVKAAQMNVYGETGNNALVIAQINRGNNVMVTGMLGGWIRIKLSEDQNGWVKMADLTNLTDATASAAPKPTITELFRRTAPVITVDYPKDNLTIKKNEINLIGKIEDDQSITRMEISVNGNKFKTLPETKDEKTDDLLTTLDFKESIPLKTGKNTITITSYDNDNLIRTKTLTISRTAEKEEIWAVLIGIGSHDKEIKPIRHANNNIQSMREYLIEDLGVPEKNVTVLMDQKATLAQIKKVLGIELSKKAGKEDQVIIYYAGRGLPEEDPSSLDEDGYEKYLIPYDADPEYLYSTALHMDELSKIFRRIKAERLIFIADTSFARTGDGKPIRDLTISEKFWERILHGKGRIILASSKPTELSQELDDLKHGVFTYYLLEGMKGKADLDGDGLVDIDEVYLYTTKKVTEITGKQQNPVKIGEIEGQFVLGRVK